MLEWLHFILGGCVGEGTEDSDRIAALTENGESLKQEGALSVIICALRNAPSKVVQAVYAVRVNGSHYYYKLISFRQDHRTMLP